MSPASCYSVFLAPEFVESMFLNKVVFCDTRGSIPPFWVIKVGGMS